MITKITMKLNFNLDLKLSKPIEDGVLQQLQDYLKIVKTQLDKYKIPNMSCH